VSQQHSCQVLNGEFEKEAFIFNARGSSGLSESSQTVLATLADNP
jgi:hypothetical protein